MAVADLADALEVALLRRDAAAGVLERLEDHRPDGGGILEEDPLLDLVGGPQRVAVLGPVVGVRVRDVVTPGDQRLEVGPQGGDPGRGERAQRRTVVGDLAGDELRLPWVARPHVVGAGQLDRRLDGLGAARGEEDAVEIARRKARDPRGELDRAGVGVAPERREVELLDLAGSGLAQLGAPMAGVAAEQAGEAVQVAVPVLVVDVGPLATNDDRNVGVGVGAHPREVHPEVALCQLLEASRRGLGGRGGGGHGSLSSSPTSEAVSTFRTTVPTRLQGYNGDRGQTSIENLYDATKTYREE